MNNKVLKFQKDCFKNYLADIRKSVKSIPNPYIYPDGNPIRPVIPTKTTRDSIMLIGAFPSARFEKRDKMLIPVGDNLSPFGHEEYFDGERIRSQASRDGLDKDYFTQLGIDPDKIWITDIVKVYLYPQKHIKNCKIVPPNIDYVETHKLFLKIASASMEWLIKEIDICNPRLIITLGEVPARTISEDKKTPTKELLNGEVRTVSFDKDYKIAHLGHPEIRRRDKNWDDITEQAIKRLAENIPAAL
ncbi:MAG: hypothetical protein KAR21_25125 [Spirochaetales bacterium]|nr:hypothetical protein [Spirochaetales bacterium]